MVDKATDAQRYAILSKNMIEGKGYFLGGWLELLFPPGYSLLLTPFLLLGLNLDMSVNMFLAFVAGGFGLLSYVLINRNKKVYGLTILAVFLNGYFLLWGLRGQVEFAWLLILLAAIYFRTNDCNIIEGLFWSLAYLLKPETLAYIGLLVIYDLITKRQKGWLKLYLLPALVIVGYSVFLYFGSGKFSLSGKSAVLMWDRWVEADVVREKYVYRLNEDGSVGIDLRNVRVAGIDWLGRLSINLSHLKEVLFEVLLPLKWVVAVLLSGFGVFRKLRRRMITESFLLVPLLPILLFHVERRYLTILVVVVYFWLVRFVVKGLSSNKVLKKVVGGLSLVLLFLVIWFSRLPLISEYPGLVERKTDNIGKAQQLPVDISITYARKPVYSYYRDLDYYPLPFIEESEDVDRYVENIKNMNGVMIHDDWSRYTLPKTHEYLIKRSGQTGFGYVGLGSQ